MWVSCWTLCKRTFEKECTIFRSKMSCNSFQKNGPKSKQIFPSFHLISTKLTVVDTTNKNPEWRKFPPQLFFCWRPRISSVARSPEETGICARVKVVEWSSHMAIGKSLYWGKTTPTLVCMNPTIRLISISYYMETMRAIGPSRYVKRH